MDIEFRVRRTRVPVDRVGGVRRLPGRVQHQQASERESVQAVLRHHVVRTSGFFRSFIGGGDGERNGAIFCSAQTCRWHRFRSRCNGIRAATVGAIHTRRDAMNAYTKRTNTCRLQC